MSCLLLPGNDARYRLVIGIRTQLPIPVVFGQVWDLPSGQAVPEGSKHGLVLEASSPPLPDFLDVLALFAPYGQIPLTIQLRLLEELDALLPLPISTLGRYLAAICQQAPGAHLTSQPVANERVLLMLNAQGWQMHPWPTKVPFQAHIAHLLFPDQQAPLDIASAYASDEDICFHLHTYGMRLHLPVFALFLRGAGFSGPVAIAQQTQGLTAAQVRVLQREMVFVPEPLRLQVSALWYRGWSTLLQRGWETFLTAAGSTNRKGVPNHTIRSINEFERLFIVKREKAVYS